MQQDLEQTGFTTPEDEAPLLTAAARRRVLLGLIVLLCMLLLAVVPPYFSISRYGRHVASAISGALGRPVHFDDLSVHLLPIPGLTIRNFVVSENPEFGAEPVLRANSVEARLRVSSLWRQRLEVSRISLESPSINLVRRRDDGRWNLQGILMQASQINSAPTAQKRAGDTPRFPYIEATDARINVKNDVDKLPFSVKEAEFALWLPQPDQWRLRMVGKPVRTDTDVNDVGLLRVEATLGRAADLSTAPIDLSASWKPTPLGEAAKLTAGYDLGWRGAASATAQLHGTLGKARLVSDLNLLALHRADFLPEQNAEVHAHCEAETAGLLRSLHDLRCAVPTDTSLSVASIMDALRKLPASSGPADLPDDAARPGVLLLRGKVPNVLDWSTASGSASLSKAPIDYAVIWARLLTQSIPADVRLGGTFDLTASTESAETAPRTWEGSLICACILPEPPPEKGRTAAAAKPSKPQPNLWTVVLSHGDSRTGSDAGLMDGVNVSAYPDVPGPANEAEVASEPISSDVPIAGEVGRAGYILRYRSRAAVQQVAAVLPFLGKDAPVSANGPLAAGGTWSTPQVWKLEIPAEREPTAHRHRRRR